MIKYVVITIKTDNLDFPDSTPFFIYIIKNKEVDIATLTDLVKFYLLFSDKKIRK